MKVTVAICTWNRARLLDQTLQSLSRLAVPRDTEWELVLVDNNSTDPHLPEVLDRWTSQLPMRVVNEPEQGHSASRNCAVQHASGEYIVWTDNDVMVSEHWLSAYLEAFQKHPAAGFFGGPIEPLFENGRPEWIGKAWSVCAPVFAARDLGPAERPLDERSLPYGANFAVRTDLQRQYRYDTRWGRHKSGMLGEDEVSVLRCLVADGVPGCWVPQAELQHLIPPDRATPKYVRGYYRGQGVANAMKGKVDRTRPSIWWDAVWNELGYRLHRIFSPPLTWVSRMIHAQICWGELEGLRREQINDNDQ